MVDLLNPTETKEPVGQYQLSMRFHLNQATANDFFVTTQRH